MQFWLQHQRYPNWVQKQPANHRKVLKTRKFPDLASAISLDKKSWKTGHPGNPANDRGFKKIRAKSDILVENRKKEENFCKLDLVIKFVFCFHCWTSTWEGKINSEYVCAKTCLFNCEIVKQSPPTVPPKFPHINLVPPKWQAGVCLNIPHPLPPALSDIDPPPRVLQNSLRSKTKEKIT